MGVGADPQMLQKQQSAVHIGVGKALMVGDPGEGHYYFAVTKLDERNEVPRNSSSSSECKARLLEIFHDSPSLLPIFEVRPSFFVRVAVPTSTLSPHGGSGGISLCGL